MKKNVLFLSLVFACLFVLAQVPQTFPYQAVARDASGNLLANQNIALRFSILDGSSSGTVVYQETQTATTNALGLFNLNIGQGTVVSGTFGGVAWGNSSKYVKVELDPAGGSSYTVMGTSQLLSVPYALYANNATATYRWATFSTYEQCCNWAMNNDASLFGGINPSTWTDGNGQAYQMSSDKEVLRALYTKKGYAKKNALIMNEDWMSYSSTNGKVVTVLFRINNTTGSAITWSPNFWYSAYSAWSEVASVSLNGANTWSANASGQTTLSLSIPANRVSTVIFVSTSGVPAGSMRNVRLGFVGNSLALPAGLEFIDDLDTATGGWTQ